MGKLSALWSKQSRSTVASDEMREKLGLLFITPNATRWNSVYDSMERVQRLLKSKPAELQSIFTAEKLRPITDGESKFLDEFIMVMKPLAVALDVIQGDSNVCAAFLLPTLQSVMADWRDIERENDLQYCCGLLSALIGDLNSRFEKELNSEYFQIAAALHPQFKLRWVPGPEREEVKTKVKRALEQFEHNSCSNSFDSANASSNTNSQPVDSDVVTVSKQRSLFWRYERPSASTPCNPGAASRYEVWCSWIESWDKEVPEVLQDAYIKYNTSIPSSASVERLFSLSKRVLSPHRSLLADDAFEWCVFLPASKTAGI